MWHILSLHFSVGYICQMHPLKCFSALNVFVMPENMKHFYKTPELVSCSICRREIAPCCLFIARKTGCGCVISVHVRSWVIYFHGNRRSKDSNAQDCTWVNWEWSQCTEENVRAFCWAIWGKVAYAHVKVQPNKPISDGIKNSQVVTLQSLTEWG